MNGRRHLDDLDDDIRDHVERETQDNIDRGMSPTDARAAALRKFGNIARVKEDTRAVWVPVWIDQLLQDARYALRMLRRSPAFNAVVILTLAIGIGLTTAVFGAVNAVLVRPLKYVHPERVVWVATYDDRRRDEIVLAVDFLGWRDHAESFERLAAFFVAGERVAVNGEVVQARIAAVSDGFWEISGARPELGRVLGRDEEGVLLSHAFFERWFHGDPAIVGKPVLLDGRQMTVVGVLPAGFAPQFPPPPAFVGLEPGEVDLYRATIARAPRPGGPMQLFNAIGRLKPGVSIDRARGELERIRLGLKEAYGGNYAPPRLSIVPYAAKLVGQARAPLLLLFGAVVLVLIVACANIANLLLAGGSARQREIAIRTAVGAGRGRMLRQFLVESLLLAAIGAAGGIALARVGIVVMMRLIPYAVPRLVETTIDGRVVAFALLSAVTTALMFGFAPALALWKPNVHEMLKDGARTASAAAGSLRVRKALVAFELALTVVLLIGAGLLARSFWRITANPPGFAPDRLLTMKVQFSGPDYRNAEKRRAYIDEVLRRVNAEPDVESAGISSSADGKMALLLEGAPPTSPSERPFALSSCVSAGYASTIGMRLLQGRWPTDAEPSPAYVVNEALVRKYFDGKDPIGKRLHLPRVGNDAFGSIVGVVADLRYLNLDETPEPELFADYQHSTPFGITIVMRMRGDPAAAAAGLRTLLAGIDRSQAIYNVSTLDATLAESVAPRRFNMLLLGTFAASALLLALVGVYAVIAYAVAQRTHEIGVRMALGAERRTVVRMIVQQGMGIALAGLVLGLAAALALTRVMTSLLYEVTPTDPATFAAVIGALAATALAACCGPALKAARVDPLVALRCE
jgi:predicted permease